jgi:5-deoxy-glucuronate isomerase
LKSNQSKPVRLDNFLNKASALKQVSLQVFRSESPVPFKSRPGETFLCVLSGSLDVQLVSHTFKNIGKRKTPFRGKAEGFFLPAHTSATIHPRGPAEFALCYTSLKPKKQKIEPFVVRQKDVYSRIRGQKGSTRKVMDILRPTHAADYLLIGETLSRPGQWSSYPPHKHDQHIPKKETCLEEIYYYRLQPDDRFGFQGLYTRKPDRTKAYMVHNHDAIAISEGYHPVSSPPDAQMYYLWVLAGKHRMLLMHDDPLFKGGHS